MPPDTPWSPSWAESFPPSAASPGGSAPDAATGDVSSLADVADLSQVGEARRRLVAMARDVGFDEEDQGRVALAVTEVATNLARHAGGGQLVARRVPPAASPGAASSGAASSGAASSGAGLEVLALDRGSGIADLPRALRDGYSTGGTAGAGLGALGRVSDAFAMHTTPGRGTAILLRFWPTAPGASVARLGARGLAEAGAGASAAAFGAVCLPVRGETACGDAWARYGTPGTSDERLVVVDGLGHGPPAAAAAAAALAAARRVFDAAPDAAPAQALHAIHAALRATRGAAVAVAALDAPAGRLRFAGVGNIAGSILLPAVAPASDGPGTSAGPVGPGDPSGGRTGAAPRAGVGGALRPGGARPAGPRSGGAPRRGGEAQSLVSHNGTVGHLLRKVQEFEYAWPPGALLVLHSDGLGSQWRFDDEPGLATRDAALVAGVLFRDWTRGRDDVTVVVARQDGAP